MPETLQIDNKITSCVMFLGRNLYHDDVLVTNKQLKLPCLLIRSALCGSDEPRTKNGIATVKAGTRFRVSFFYNHDQSVAGVKLIYNDTVDRCWSDEAPGYSSLIDFAYLDSNLNDFDFEKITDA